MADEEKFAELETWMAKLFQRTGIQTVTLRGEGGPVQGMLNVPAKYVDVIGAMKYALECTLTGRPLPEITAKPTPVSGAKKKR